MRRPEAGGGCRGEELAALSDRLYAHYASTSDPALPEALARRATPWIEIALVPAIRALLGRGERPELYLSERNDGYLPGLPASAIVEKRALLDRDGLRPFPLLGNVEERCRDHLALLRSIAEYEHLALEAALEPDEERVARALRAQPIEVSARDLPRLTAAILEEAPR